MVPIYLDQNVYSRLLPTSPARDNVRKFLARLQDMGGVFVYSWLHVEETRSFDRPEDLVRIFEELDAQYIEPLLDKSGQFTLTKGRARSLMLSDPDFADQAMRAIEMLLKPMHFAFGWLGSVQADDLAEEIVSEVNAFWDRLEKELPGYLIDDLSASREECVEMARSMCSAHLQVEAAESHERLRARLPPNLAQLDEIPAKEVVSYVMSLLDDKEQQDLKDHYPKGFWSQKSSQEEGKLAGFAFLLFAWGMVRDRRTRTGDRIKRERHFLGQFRDCQHIEAAAHFPFFITFDKGAFRLAEAVYAWAGLSTRVCHLVADNS